MRKWVMILAMGFVLTAAHPQRACADDAPLERAKEMLRRTQEALRQSQAQNAELAKAKAEAEQKAAAATADAGKQVEAVKKSAERNSGSKLKSAQEAQNDLQQKLTLANSQLVDANEKQRITAQALANRDAELALTKTQLEQTKAAVVSCEDKNDKLYTYGAEMLDKYQKKGVFSALAQKEPVLGFKQVEIENVVQEYKIKMAAEKIGK